jgi:hypothetical protein
MRRIATAVLAMGALAVACSSTGEPTDQARDPLETPACDAGLTNCNGSCVDTLTDSSHCGGCGYACSVAEGFVCKPGRLANGPRAGTLSGGCAYACQAGLVYCAGTCVDPHRDIHHCGGCDHACESGQLCNLGACITGCPNGKAYCGGVCTNTSNDPANCGQCGNSCLPEYCVDGRCESECPGPTPDRCPRRESAGTYGCTSLYLDHDNCGHCGVVCGYQQRCHFGHCAHW